ncbi:toll/interleukin-1 receptor domain-containing protein [Frankia canadensis]|nr:toll/interleukin-1 receptor domain-containing protein [Frankia canadensis]
MSIGGWNQPSGEGRWDFFVSYTARDRSWAEWIAWQLESADFRVLVQAWDMVAGSNWTATMQDGIRYSTRTLAVCSNAYLESVFGEQEWQAAFAADPTGADRRLLPVRIEACPRPGVLNQRVSVDLFSLSPQDARDALLQAVREAIAGRAKPPAEPRFPGGGPMPPRAPATSAAPTFPGHSDSVAAGPTITAPSGRAAPGAEVGECRALLIGVAGYEDDALPARPELTPQLDAVAEALEGVGYRAEVHDRSRLGGSAVKTAIHSFLRDAGPADTLLLLLAGHGVHHDGRDFLVPADADTGYQPFWDVCVRLDWSETISRSPARRVLVLVDAADDLDEALRVTLTEDGWSEGRLSPGDGTDHAYLVRRTRYPHAASPLLRVLTEVLGERPAPADLPALRAALRRHLTAMAPTSLGGPGGRDGSGWPGDAGDQAGPSCGTPAVAGRGEPCELRVVEHCDPARFRPFPAAPVAGASAVADHPWRRAAERHAAWTLMTDTPGAEELRTATIELAGVLGGARDRAAARLPADPWLDQQLALRLVKRVEFLARLLGTEPPPLSPAEAALLVAMPFLGEAVGAILVADATVAHPGAGATADLRSGAAAALTADFASFSGRHPRLLRRIDRARRTADAAAAEAIGWWLAHRWSVWRSGSQLGPVLGELLGGLDPDLPIGEVLTGPRIIALLTALRAEPAYLNRPGRAATLRDQVTVAAATADEMTLRERFVGYLLAVAHRMALEPAALPVVVVEHLGVADAVDLAALAETIRGAQWQKRGRSGRALSARCQHQAAAAGCGPARRAQSRGPGALAA